MASGDAIRVGPFRTGRLALLALFAALVGACAEPARRAPSDSAGASREVARVPGDSAVGAVAAESLGTGIVYTANEGDQSISRIDLATGRVVTFPIGFTPHNVQISPDGRRLYAVGSLSAEMPGMAMSQRGARPPGVSRDSVAARPGQLLILDATATDTVGATRIMIGRDPAHVVLGVTGERAYTTSAAQDAVQILDVGRQHVLTTISTPASPHGLRMRPGGREIYVAGTGGNAVAVIDVERSREAARIPVGRGPVQIGFVPDGNRAYVSLRDDNAVAAIDTRTRRVIATIPVGRSPIQLFTTPDGRFVYVANQGTEAEPDSTVSVIDIEQNAVVRTIITGRGAHGVVVGDDGRQVFIANVFAGTVSVIDVTTQRVTGTVRVGAGPGGITYRATTP